MDEQPGKPDHSLIEINDLGAAARRNKWLILGCVAISALASTGIALLTPDTWQASAIVRIGMIGTQKNPVEPIANVMVRLNDPSYQQEISRSLPPPANEHIGSLKTTPIPNTNLLEVTVKGRNASEVKQLIEAVIHHLRLTHDKIAEPAITLQQKRLDALTNTISQSRQQLKALRSSPSLPTPVTDSAVLYHFLINQQDTELAQLEGEKNTLELSLSPTSTYSTALFSQIKVENKAQTPNRLLLILTGSFVGCIVGLFISVALTRLQRSQGKPISSDIHM